MCFVESVHAEQKSHMFDSTSLHLNRYELFGMMCEMYLYWKVLSLVSTVSDGIWQKSWVLSIVFRLSNSFHFVTHLICLGLLAFRRRL